MSVIVRQLTRKITAGALSLLMFWCIVQLPAAQADTQQAAWKLTSTADGLNMNPSRSAAAPKTAVWNNELYAIWAESNGDMFDPKKIIRVKKLDGENWVPANDGNGLNVSLNQDANGPALAAYEGYLYAIWEEVTAGNKKVIRVKKFDGSQWETADGGVSLNGSGSSANNQSPVLAVYKDDLYAAWLGNNNGGTDKKVQIKKFDGNSWTTDASDLTLVPGGFTNQLQFTVYQDKLYLTWSESTLSSPSLNYISVFQKSGTSSWTNVSGATGLSDPSKPMVSPAIQAYNGLLYAVWRDGNTATFLIKSYDGSAWSQVGNGTLDTSGNAAQPQLAVYNDQLFLSWLQSSSPITNKIRVYKFDGASWTATDDALLGTSNGQPSSLAVASDALHLLWSDSNKVRSSSYQEFPGAPAAPTGLTVSSGNQKATLSWDNGGSGLDYKIYQGSESGVYDPTPVATVSGSSSYTATGLTNGSTYYYAVTASNDIGESGYSNEASVKAGVINAVLTEGCSYLWTANSQEAFETCDANPLWVGTLTNYDIGGYQPRSTAEAVLKFDLPAVDAPIVSAQLKAYVPKKQVSSGANDATITIYDGDPDWQPYNAGSGTPVVSPQPANLSTPKFYINTPPSWNTYDVTFPVLESADQGRDSVTLILQGTKTNSDSLASNLDLLYNMPGYEAVLELTLGEPSQPELAPQIGGLIWAPGGTAGTTKLTGVNGDPILRYAVGAAGQYTQPVVGADAADLGYTLSLDLDADIAVVSGQHIYVVAVDSLGHIVEWADAAIADAEINPGSNQQPELAPQISGLTWAPGSAAGTTKLTGVSGDPLLRYAVGAAGQYTQPVVGADARDLGYVKLRDLNVDIAVTSGQHIYVVSVDSRGGIIEWADVAIADAEINLGSNQQPELAPQISSLTWAPGGASGTTKLTGVSGDPILRYATGAAGQYTQPVVGADAHDLGYTLPLNLNADIVVTSGQHIYVVAVDNQGRIVEWADVAVADADISTAAPVYPPYTPPASASSQDEGFAIKVNEGELQDQTATAKVDQTGGKKRTTVSIDGKKLSGRLANTTGAVVSIPVHNGSDTVIGELDAQTVKAMESSKAVLRIESEHVVYTIPASQINVSALSSQFGADIDLSDIVILVTIANVPDQDVMFLPQEGQQLQMIAPAVDFSITAVYQGREVKVDMFNAYVERMIAIPEGVDPGKITTGVVVLADGNLLHVPTKVMQLDGKYYAVINSLTNSVYSVVYNVKTFEDIAKHWAQASIEDMAARLVLSGGTNNQYVPDEAITRAEFAAIMVRGLGLHNAKQPPSFSDVRSSDWFHNAVAVAASFGLLQGYPDGTFRPNHSITRQEAMVIAAKAMDIADMDTAITSAQRDDLLTAFKDAGQFGGWAKSAAALNIRFGVIGGSGGTVRPLDQVTRAETAAIVQRLLKQAGLI
ncbi:S-layer homology domain-containing protein [Paenibacillus nasutitermitis]|uniref:S-layer homology domain-containing protein n=1 Tax=Paenibacillus nasutitermitis TaxID=1652958 RepID=A0A917DZM9_9BACL|nr:S-layer homology domain-containing protein [Paenibacillus nasutitermitis]GGD82166.1 hypothetical protein GCM10010911_45360 [Paenibacillus nasutitermitis]